MGAIASQITSLTIVYSIVYSDADQRKHQSSASLAFVRWIHRGPVKSPHKWSVTRKMFPLHDVIMFHERSVTGRTLYKDQSCGHLISGYRIFCCSIFSIIFFSESGSLLEYYGITSERRKMNWKKMIQKISNILRMFPVIIWLHDFFLFSWWGLSVSNVTEKRMNGKSWNGHNTRQNWVATWI